jgi:hypothetical protein
VLSVPDGVGLGVSLDEVAVARMAERHRSEGAMAGGSRYRSEFRQY